MEAFVFQGLPVTFPVGEATRTRAFQHDMATFLELWLAACRQKAPKALLMTSTINIS